MVQTTNARFLMQVLCITLYASPTYQGRKYDIEAESLKLFREDLPTVLQRFRRTADYLKILQDKSEEYYIYVMDVKNQITYYYLDELEKRVADLIGYKPEPLELGANPAPSGAEPPNGLLLRAQRRGSDGNFTPVERLDSYPKLSTALSLSQRNAMRDLGFQFASHTIQALVKNLGSDDDMVSTRQPAAASAAAAVRTNTPSASLRANDKIPDVTVAAEDVQKRFHVDKRT